MSKSGKLNMFKVGNIVKFKPEEFPDKYPNLTPNGYCLIMKIERDPIRTETIYVYIRDIANIEKDSSCWLEKRFAETIE